MPSETIPHSDTTISNQLQSERRQPNPEQGVGPQPAKAGVSTLTFVLEICSESDLLLIMDNTNKDKINVLLGYCNGLSDNLAKILVKMNALHDDNLKEELKSLNDLKSKMNDDFEKASRYYGPS